MATNKDLLPSTLKQIKNTKDKDTVILTKNKVKAKKTNYRRLKKILNLKIQKHFYSRLYLLKRKKPSNKKIPSLYLQKQLLPLLQGLTKFKD